MNKEIIKLILIILMLLSVGLYFVSGTYARYRSTASGIATVNVAKWAGAVNDADITRTNTFTLTFKETENNLNVVDGFIAPTSEFYAEFIIDPAGSEVAIDYSFEVGNLTTSAGTLPAGLTISSVSEVIAPDTMIEATKEGDSYVGTIKLTSRTAALTSAQAKTFRVYVTWVDDTANNIADTTFGIGASTLSVPVTVTLTQDID